MWLTKPYYVKEQPKLQSAYVNIALTPSFRDELLNLQLIGSQSETENEKVFIVTQKEEEKTANQVKGVDESEEKSGFTIIS